MTPDVPTDSAAGPTDDDAALRALPPAVLASIIGGLDDAVGIFSSDGVVVWANAACRQVTGVKIGARLGAGFIAEHGIVNEDGTPTPPGDLTMLAAIRTQQPASANVRGFMAVDGTRHWVNVRTSPFHHADGTFGGAVVVFTDVTARVNADRERREMADRLETLLATMSDGVFVVDEHGIINFANAAALRIMGFEREVFVGSHYGNTRVRRYARDGALVDPSGFPARRGLEGDGEQFTLRYEGFPTGTKWLESRVSPVRDAAGNGRGAVVSFTDVTEHFVREAEHRQREQNFDAILGATLSGILMMHPDGEIVYANEAAARIMGVPVAELLGAPHAAAQLVIYDDTGWPIPVERRPLAIALREGRSSENVQVSIRRADGTRWLSINAAPVFGEDGTPRAAVSSFIDITDRRLLNEQLQQSQKMEGIGRLAGGIAHDFNNIITAIVGNIDFAAEAAPADSEQLHDLEQAREAAQRGAALTRQLLTFARRQPVNPQPLRLDELAAGMDRMLRRVLGEDVTLETRSVGDLWSVRADASQMEQVILNLAVNARDAMPHGGTLVVDTSNQVVAGGRLPGGAESGEFVVLTVSDTGVGMTAEIREHIFEPFFTTRPVGAGTGLGLSTVYGIVQDAGGFVRVESESGAGTSFRVYLPRSLTEAAPGAVGGEIGPSRGSGTVLVVEDETAVRQLVERSLRAYGYTVIAAADGREALGIVERSGSDIDIVITDVIMPGLSGTDLAARLQDTRPGLPVLFMSGYPDHSRNSSAQIPAERLLQKPFTPAQLVRRVQLALEQGL